MSEAEKGRESVPFFIVSLFIVLHNFLKIFGYTIDTHTILWYILIVGIVPPF